MIQFHQGETFRLTLNLKDALGDPANLAGVTAEARHRAAGIDTTFPASIDAGAGSVDVEIDRDITAAWPAMRHALQVWLDYGEGAEIEARMVYQLDFEVRDAI